MYIITIKSKQITLVVLSIRLNERKCIMENLAKVDKLAEITGASFDEARMALRACHWETLEIEALIGLKRSAEADLLYRETERVYREELSVLPGRHMISCGIKLSCCGRPRPIWIPYSPGGTESADRHPL